MTLCLFVCREAKAIIKGQAEKASKTSLDLALAEEKKLEAIDAKTKAESRLAAVESDLRESLRSAKNDLAASREDLVQKAKRSASSFSHAVTFTSITNDVNLRGITLSK